MAKGLPYSLSRGSAQRQEIIKQRVAIDDVTITVSSTGANIGFGTAVIAGLPEGNILFHGAVAYVALAGSGSDVNLVDTWSGDFGIGTTPADDATITGTDVDIISSTAVGPATAEAVASTRGVSVLTGGDIFDNTDESLELNLNVLIDASDIVDDSSVDITANGELWILYTVMGDD